MWSFLGIVLGVAMIAAMGIIARKKGFRPALWYCALGIIGAIVLLCLPSATTPNIETTISQKRRRIGNLTGGILTITFGFVFLVTLMVVQCSRGEERALQAKAATGITILEKAIDEFVLDCGRWPFEEEGLQALIEEPGNTRGWHGPYLTKDQLTDPWGNAYKYRRPGVHNRERFDLWSKGPDELEEGDDNIGNWPDVSPQVEATGVSDIPLAETEALSFTSLELFAGFAVGILVSVLTYCLFFRSWLRFSWLRALLAALTVTAIYRCVWNWMLPDAWRDHLVSVDVYGAGLTLWVLIGCWLQGALIEAALGYWPLVWPFGAKSSWRLLVIVTAAALVSTGISLGVFMLIFHIPKPA